MALFVVLLSGVRPDFRYYHLLMAMATIFGNVMTLEQVPERIASAILSFTENKIAILLLINLLLLWVGTFMEALAAIVILTPILLPWF